MVDVQARSVAELLRLRQRHPGAQVVVVSHAAALRAVTSHFLGLPLDLALRLEVDRGSQAELWLGDETARLRSWSVGVPCASADNAVRASRSTRSTSTA